MSISTFDAAVWRQYAPTGADYGDHIQTSSGSVLLDGCCFVSAAVRDVDHSQKDPVIMERIMERLTSRVKAHTAAAAVRLADLEAYTLRNGVDALKARFAYSR